VRLNLKLKQYEDKHITTVLKSREWKKEKNGRGKLPVTEPHFQISFRALFTQMYHVSCQGTVDCWKTELRAGCTVKIVSHVEQFIL
jgi:hypothetical protein